MKKLLLILVVFLSATAIAFSQPCVGTETITATPPPNSNNQYFPGQNVTICYTVTDYAQNGVDWLAGAVPTLGPGWDLSTLQPVSAPASCDGLGNWAWYTSCTGTASGNTYGPGFYYDTPSGSPNGLIDGIPGNNFGDNCQNYTWEFCFSVSVLMNAPNGMDLTVSVNALSDYEAGSWGTDGCQDPINPNNTIPATVANCLLVVPTVTVVNATCGNSNDGSLTAIPAGVPPYTYLWNTGATTPTINNLAPGIYTVTVTDSTLCSKTVTVPVGGPTPIMLNAVIVDNGCSGTGGSITLNPTGGAGLFTFLWNDGSTSNAITNLIGGTYSVVVTDSAGCTDSSSFTINDVIPVSLSTSTTSSGCNAQDGTATVNASGGTGPYTYNWQPTGGTDSIATNLAPGQYAVTVTDVNGCTATANVTVAGINAFTLTSQFVPLQCDPSGTTSASVSINGGTGPYNIQWLPFGGTDSSATGLTSGTYTVIVTDANSCIDSVTINIPGVTPITATTSTTPVQCNSPNSGSVTVSASGLSPFTYLWSNGETGATISNVGGGTYTVTVTDVNGCTAQFTETVNVIPDVQASAGNNQTSCSGEPVVLSGSASGGTGPFNYLWNTGETTGDITVTPSSSTVYTLTVTDANNCTSTATVTVDVEQYPVVITSGNVTICDGASTSISASGGNTYTWLPVSGLSDPNSSNPVASPSTTTTYLVTVSNGQCSSTGTVEVTVEPSANASFIPDTTQGEAPLEVTFTNTSSNGVSYQWNFGDLSLSTDESPSHVYTQHGNYTVELIATNAAGCTDTARYSFIVVNEFAALIIPNVFTPNGDGFNDTFHFIEKGIESISVVIFNRWGNEIYSWNKKEGEWNGKFADGGTAPDGVYMYIVKAIGIDDKPYNYQGTVQLIRVEK